MDSKTKAIQRMCPGGGGRCASSEGNAKTKKTKRAPFIDLFKKESVRARTPGARDTAQGRTVRQMKTSDTRQTANKEETESEQQKGESGPAVGAARARLLWGKAKN